MHGLTAEFECIKLVGSSTELNFLPAPSTVLRLRLPPPLPRPSPDPSSLASMSSVPPLSYPTPISYHLYSCNIERLNILCNGGGISFFAVRVLYFNKHSFRGLQLWDPSFRWICCLRVENVYFFAMNECWRRTVTISCSYQTNRNEGNWASLGYSYGWYTFGHCQNYIKKTIIELMWILWNKTSNL